MISKIFTSILIIMFSILFSGCTRVIDWGERTFYQGCKIEECLDVPRQHIRTTRVYDQFSTIGIFNAMLITDDVLYCYAKMHGEKYGLDEQAIEELFQKEREKYKDYISFYILAFDPKEKDNPLYLPTKNTQESNWTVYLKIKNDTYEPVNLKKVELNPEISQFFGKYLSKFKTTYLVQFLADGDRGALVTPDIRSIGLCFVSFANKVGLTWGIDLNGKIIDRYKGKGCYCLDDSQQICEFCCDTRLKNQH